MIEHKITFDAPVDLANARQNVVNWLQALRYQLATPPFLSDLVFERGSAMGNATAVNPQKWRSKVTASFRAVEEHRTRVEIEWKVVTTGQMVTKMDMDYWRSEIAGTQAAAEGRTPDVGAFEKKRQEDARKYVAYIIPLTALIVSPLILALFMRHLEWPLYTLSAVLGLATYFGFRAPQKP